MAVERKRFFEHGDAAPPLPAKKKRKEGDGAAAPVADPEAEKALVDAKAKVPGVKQDRLPIKKFTRGPRNKWKGLEDKKLRGQIKMKERMYTKSAMTAAQVERWLLPSEGGMLEAEDGEDTCDFTQQDIVREVDILSSRKAFDLKLPVLGPYNIDYTHNGRYLLLGGRKGHLAMVDWNTSHLVMEAQLAEATRDVKFLHNEQFFAAAQKKYIYIYDKKGAEVHCLKEYQHPLKLEFLRHHFLLVGINKNGILHYQDTSTGRIVANFNTRLGRCNVMRVNPYNAVVHLGHTNGTVTMWSPNVKTPLVTVLCHRGPVTAAAVDISGNYMVTSGTAAKIKVWDIRKMQELHTYASFGMTTSVDISQKGMIAVGQGSSVVIWKDCLATKQDKPYMRHRLASTSSSTTVQDMSFCPYEDVLGVGHASGFTSMLVPGSGEPNFDALVANPFETTKQRREGEVQMLLDKLQPETIMLDSSKIGSMMKPKPATVQKQEESSSEDEDEGDEASKRVKHKMKGRSKPGRVEAKKQESKYNSKRSIIRQQKWIDKKRDEEIAKKAEESGKKQVESGLAPLPRALARFA